MNKRQAFAPETRRIPMADQVEYDLLTTLHRTTNNKAGERKVVKHKYHRRWRQQAKRWARTVAPIEE